MAEKLSESNPAAFDLGGKRQDELFGVLSHPHRRFTLQYLQTTDALLPVTELATELEAWEGQRTAPDNLVSDENGIEISLVHHHLPKMAEAELVRYDATQRTVTLADRTDEVRTHLPPIAGEQYRE